MTLLVYSSDIQEFVITFTQQCMMLHFFRDRANSILLGGQVKWKLTNKLPSLERQIVHVWRASLDLPMGLLTRAQLSLSPDEYTRANRFYFDIDRRRYIAARGTLRAILGAYSGIPAGDLRFDYNEYGRPELNPDSNPCKLSFNLSHANEIMLCALTVNRDIGVDVEKIRSLRGLYDMTKTVLSVAEQARFRAVPSVDQLSAFFSAWTQKEAYTKAIGRGLSFGLQTVEVAFDPGSLPRLLFIGGEEHATNGWSLRQFRPVKNHIGVVAVRGTELDFEYYMWTPDVATSRS